MVHTLLYIAMDLKDFVSETLKEIIAGVKEAQEYAKEHGAIINPTKFGIVAPTTYHIENKIFTKREY